MECEYCYQETIEMEPEHIGSILRRIMPALFIAALLAATYFATHKTQERVAEIIDS